MKNINNFVIVINTMERFSETILTRRQWQIIELKSRGRSNREIASTIGTSVQNVIVLENRVRKKIKMARNTLDLIDGLYTAGKVEIEGGTHLLDAVKKILEESDRNQIRLTGNLIDLMNTIRVSCHDIIRNGILTERVSIYVDKKGEYSVHRHFD